MNPLFEKNGKYGKFGNSISIVNIHIVQTDALFTEGINASFVEDYSTNGAV